MKSEKLEKFNCILLSSLVTTEYVALETLCSTHAASVPKYDSVKSALTRTCSLPVPYIHTLDARATSLRFWTLFGRKLASASNTSVRALRTFVHACVRVPVSVRAINACVRAYVRACVHAYVRACLCACVRA